MRHLCSDDELVISRWGWGCDADSLDLSYHLPVLTLQSGKVHFSTVPDVHSMHGGVSAHVAQPQLALIIQSHHQPCTPPLLLLLFSAGTEGTVTKLGDTVRVGYNNATQNCPA